VGTLRYLVITTLLLLIGSTSFAQKFIKQTATGSGNGTSWDNAFGASSLRSALTSGGVIYIAAGTYNVGAAFVSDAAILPAGTTVQGGFPANATGTSTSGYNPGTNITVIDGQDKMIFTVGTGTYVIKGIVFDNAEGAGAGGSVIRANSGGLIYDWTLEDCVIKNTTGSGGGGGAVWLHGSYTAGSKIKVKNCIFDNNQAIAGSYSGALTLQAIANNSGGPAGGTNNGTDYVVENCSFSNNRVTAGGSGGAMMILSCTGINLLNNSFCNNFANNDAGALLVSSVTKFVMSGCSFSGNSNQGQWSPAVWILSSPESQVLNCNFVGNFAATGALSNNAGGGLAIESGSPHLVDGCKFYNNIVRNRGGGVQFSGGGNLTLTNCIFKGNQVTNGINAFGGGALYATAGSTAVLNFSNNVFDSNSLVDNTSGNGYGGGAIHVQGGNSPTATNSVFYNNTYNGSATVLTSDVSVFGGGTFTVSGSALQLSQATYTSFYNVSTGNTFNNTTDPGVAAAPGISCPISLPPSCVAGSTAPALSATTASNTCPATTVNLTTITASNLPAGTTLTWHTGTPATTANKIAGTAVSASGVYYAAFFDSAAGCYSGSGAATTAVTVTVFDCTPVTVTPPGTISGTSGTTIPGNPPVAIGGTGPYTYTDGSSNPGCVAPSGATSLTAAGGTINGLNPTTGAHTVTLPTAAGTYYYCIQVCDASGTNCAVSIHLVTVTCAAGSTAPALSATTASNTCPATTVNLTTITASNLPAGTTLTWHTGTPATTANKITGTAVSASGVYYAAFFDSVAGCYSGSGAATTAVTVTINTCTSVTVTPPATISGPSGSTVTGNPPVANGGTGPYTYSDGSSNPGCIAPSGATSLTAAGGTVNNLNSTTGAHTVTLPAAVGTYYYCIQVCDSTGTNCAVSIHLVTVTCAAGTVAPSVN